MKRIIVLSLCILAYTSFMAQNEFSKELFPTLAGLSRTYTIEYYDMTPNDGKRNGGYPELTAPTKDTIIDGKTYLQFDEYYSSLFLREENNKVLIYSSMLQEDLVLYDYTLGVGDSLHAITGDDWFSDANFAKLDKAKDIFTYVVTEVSMITLIDGIERKKWTLQNQYLGIMEYVEGIGCFGEKNSHSGDFFRLIYNHPYETESIGNLLVCVSQNGQLLYQMDDTEMEQLEAECLCEGYVSSSVETIITPNTNASRLLQDGQLFILRDGKTYNVMGIEVRK